MDLGSKTPKIWVLGPPGKTSLKTAGDVFAQLVEAPEHDRSQRGVGSLIKGRVHAPK